MSEATATIDSMAELTVTVTSSDSLKFLSNDYAVKLFNPYMSSTYSAQWSAIEALNNNASKCAAQGNGKNAYWEA